MCTSLNENRKELEDGFAVSESHSNQRRLDHSNNTRVISFDLVTTLVGMLDCYCDTNNPDNNGCTRAQLQFAEETVQTVMDTAADDFGGSPENALSKVRDRRRETCEHKANLTSMNQILSLQDPIHS